MPMFEYKCYTHGRFDSYASKAPGAPTRSCPKCGRSCKQVEVSVPAKRNPNYGIVR